MPTRPVSGPLVPPAMVQIRSRAPPVQGHRPGQVPRQRASRQRGPRRARRRPEPRPSLPLPSWRASSSPLPSWPACQHRIRRRRVLPLPSWQGLSLPAPSLRACLPRAVRRDAARRDPPCGGCGRRAPLPSCSRRSSPARPSTRRGRALLCWSARALWRAPRRGSSLLASSQASVVSVSGAAVSPPAAHWSSLTTEPSAAWNCSSPVSSFRRHSPSA